MGHGPHYPLPIEVYRGRPIFYGMGNLTFNIGHLGRAHAGWVGLLVELAVEGGSAIDCCFRFVRANDDNESYFSPATAEASVLADLIARSAKLAATLKGDGERVRILRC
jgi:poly-gamma-glutamate synthesis protein (capsule biosynthesis protein)